MLIAPTPGGIFLALTRAIGKSLSVEEICAAALDALAAAVGVERASILLFDPDGVMRFKASRGLSDAYRQAVEGHTPWQPDSPDPQPIVIADVAGDPSLTSYQAVCASEGIAALAFIPLVSLDRVIGKFMLYYATPTEPGADALELAGVIAAQVAFAVERTRALAQARRSEERLRFALDAASMGTWDWDLRTNLVEWSENLPVIHGLPAGAFDGTFASYEREIHPEDRERVLASARRAIQDGVPHDVEYRIVAPDGTIRWCEGKGRVEYHDGRPVHMSGVCMMVTRRKEAEMARLAAAEEVARQKDEFLATLSHELRTPLNAILGWAQMLESHELSAASIRQAVQVIGRNARLQAQLIDDILDVSRIISGKLQLERGPVWLPQLLETVVAGVTPSAAAKRIGISRQMATDVPLIEGDAKRLHQVLNNVLTNAVKFTPEDGAITVTCRRHDAWLEIEIRDSGVGIPRDFLPYVFDRFRQADNRTTRRHGGLGLGLAIARHLIERHGGDITADSQGPDTGTTVTIRLPGDVSTPATVHPAAGEAESAPNIRLDGVAVLVVDDNHDSCALVAAVLEARGAQVERRARPLEALDLVAARPFDVLIADIAMPGMDGYEFITRVRGLGHAIPAVAVTAFAHADDRQRALMAGFTRYSTKPIDEQQLAAIVRELVPLA